MFTPVSIVVLQYNIFCKEVYLGWINFQRRSSNTKTKIEMQVNLNSNYGRGQLSIHFSSADSCGTFFNSREIGKHSICLLALICNIMDIQVRCTKFEDEPGQHTLSKIQDYLWSILSVYLTIVDSIIHQYKYFPVTVSVFVCELKTVQIVTQLQSTNT